MGIIYALLLKVIRMQEKPCFRQWPAGCFWGSLQVGHEGSSPYVPFIAGICYSEAFSLLRDPQTLANLLINQTLFLLQLCVSSKGEGSSINYGILLFKISETQQIHKDGLLAWWTGQGSYFLSEPQSSLESRKTSLYFDSLQSQVTVWEVPENGGA